MDKYEYRVKTEQMLDHLEKKEYQKAMDIAESIDWRRVKNASMLNTVSEIYEYNGEFKKGRDILFLAFDRAPGSRKIVYRLGTLALKIKDIREATDCYEEFVKLAPKDPNQYILKYKILRTQGAALSDQIAALEEFKKAEYIEKWAYELAKLYDEAGMTAECLEECDDLILWFSEGKYVYLAMELKMKYKPLTPLQQEKYDSRPGAVKKQPEPVKQTESTLEEVDDENEYDEGSEEEVQESTVQRIDDAQVQEIPPEPVPMQEEFEIPEEAAQADVVPEEVVPEATAAVEETPMYREEEPEASVETPEEHTSAIKQVVTGATLEEALAQGVAVASGINIEEEAMKEREDEILANGQMMIDDILQKWEAKQKDHEEAIAKQKAKDEERLQKEREQARIRQEEERKEVERKAAEAEARRKAEEEAARKAAEESVVLLKNSNNILPLKPGTKVAVIGDFAKTPRYQGAGSSLVNPTKQPESILDVIGDSGLVMTAYEQGYIRNRKPNAALAKSAVEAAKNADVVLVFAGLDEISESEGLDRTHMHMPQAQNELIDEITAVNSNVVVVLSAGSSIEMPWFDYVKGIVHGYLGGQAGASAMMNVLTGKVCPSGKLNETYPLHYEDTPAFHYYPSKERSSEYREALYVGYRYYTTVGKKVRFPFGYGLSYTTFAYSNLSVDKDGVTFTIKNTGDVEGTEIAQLYVGKQSDP